MLDNYRTVKQQCKDPPLSEVNNIIVFIPLKPRSNFISDNIPTKTILFFFGYLEVNGTWLITSDALFLNCPSNIPIDINNIP